MTSTAAFAIVGYIVVTSLFGTGLLVLRARRRESERARIVRESQVRTWSEEAQRWVTWPSTTRAELAELELLYALPAYDQALDAGCERLWDAVRDEQQKQKGEQ